MCQIREESVWPPEEPFPAVGSLSDGWNGCVSVSSLPSDSFLSCDPYFAKSRFIHSSWNFVSN